MQEIEAFISRVCDSCGLRAQVLPANDERLVVIVNSLRKFYEENGQAYLSSRQHLELDTQLELSARSSTVVVRDSFGLVLSTVRMTPFPFETEGLIGDAVDFTPFQQCIELSRLVSWPDARFRTLPAALALATALQASMRCGDFAGFVALAKSPQRRVFSKFGLKPGHSTPIAVGLRGFGDYWFLHGALSDLVPHALRHIHRLYETDPQLVSESTA